MTEWSQTRHRECFWSGYLICSLERTGSKTKRENLIPEIKKCNRIDGRGICTCDSSKYQRQSSMWASRRLRSRHWVCSCWRWAEHHQPHQHSGSFPFCRLLPSISTLLLLGDFFSRSPIACWANTRGSNTSSCMPFKPKWVVFPLQPGHQLCHTNTKQRQVMSLIGQVTFQSNDCIRSSFFPYRWRLL